jgi:hypothetical protein
MIARGIDHGLYDLHWMDHCPLFGRLREHPRFLALRAQIKARADLIHDALYCDHDEALSETQIA